MSETKPSGLALLRMPFPPNQISKLPKPFKKDNPKGNCRDVDVGAGRGPQEPRPADQQ
jgi:hypothetical protein